MRAGFKKCEKCTYIYLTEAEVNTGVHNYRSTSQRWFLRRVQNPTSDDVVFPPRTFFYTISPHDISFLIVDSTTSNRVNRLFFLAAFHSAVTFNFLRVVVIAVFKRRARTWYHRGDTYGKLRACMRIRYWHVGHLIKKTQLAKRKDLLCATVSLYLILRMILCIIVNYIAIKKNDNHFTARLTCKVILGWFNPRNDLIQESIFRTYLQCVYFQLICHIVHRYHV